MHNYIAINRTAKSLTRNTKTAGITLLIFGILFSFVFVMLLIQSQSDEIKYEDCIYKEYTVLSVTKEKGRGSTNTIITVKEEERPLSVLSHISSVLAENNFRETIKENDVIYTYVEEVDSEKYSYNVVEIKTSDTTYLSLNDYIAADRNNTNFGLVLFSAFSLLCFPLSACCFIKHKKGVKKPR